MQTTEQYCRSFELAHVEWPSLPLPATAQELWWRNWLEQHEQQRAWDSLRLELPQLPVITWYVCNLAHLPPAPSVAVVVCAAVSTAKCQYAVARSHDVYVEETEAAVAGTTILSVVTLPVVVSLLTRQFVGVIS